MAERRKKMTKISEGAWKHKGWDIEYHGTGYSAKKTGERTITGKSLKRIKISIENKELERKALAKEEKAKKAAARTLKVQYSASYQYANDNTKWWNAAHLVKDVTAKESTRYFETKEQAEYAIKYALKKFNREYQYDEKGKRWERLDRWARMEVTKEMDDGMRIAKWRITKRFVSEWETEEEG